MELGNMIYFLVSGLIVCIVIWNFYLKVDNMCTVRRWPVVGMLPSLLLNFHRFHDWVTESLAEAGGTVDFYAPGINITVTSDPANLEYILKTKFNDFVKGEFYRQTVIEFIGESIIITNGNHFHYLTRIFLAALSSASFRKASESTSWEGILCDLLPHIERQCVSTATIDFEKLMEKFTFHTIAKAGLGVEPDAVAGSEIFLESFDTAADLSILRLALPAVIWKTMRMLQVGTERKLKASRLEAHSWIKRAIEYRRHIKQDNNDFRQGHPMDLFSAVIVQAGHIQDEQFMRDVALSIMLAGKDTLTSALSWLFWALCKYPDVQQKVYEEVSCVVVKRRRLEQLREIGVFTNEEMREMAYLHATLSEVLRLYPSIPINIVEASHDNLLPDGRFIKRGSVLLYSVYAYGRNRALWGADANEFKPERWLNDGKFFLRSEFKFMAFNAGPRRCLGRDFAYWIMKCVVASVIVRFKLSLAPGHPVIPKLSFSLGLKHGVHIIAEKRHEQS